MKKPITEYLDYREFIRDFYEERKRVSAFTWREFARLAGFVSATYLRLVCEGKTRISMPGIPKVANAMGLVGFERTYFELLVRFAHAKTEDEKKSIFAEMERTTKINKIRMVDADAFHYYESPVCPVLRELAPLMPGAQPSEIAEKIDGDVSAAEVREALQFLVKAELLEKEGNSYRQTSKVVKGSKEAIPMAIRSMNREMAHRAVDALDKFSPAERNISGLTLGVNEDAYARIVAEIQACTEKIIAIAEDCKDINQVYRMNMQLFPLTAKVNQGLDSAGPNFNKVMEENHETV